MSTNLPRPEYPRPQFRRDRWINLNGRWSYRFDFGLSGLARGWQQSAGFEDAITVPFAPESELSGVNYKDFIPALFYHRTIAVPQDWDGMRILLHFGAVDQEAHVYIDGREAGHHYGGSASFFLDITELAEAGKEHQLVVYAVDDLRGCLYGCGKQSERFHSHDCHYTRTTGIWQTVWLEAVAPGGLKSCRIVPDLDNGAFAFLPAFHGECRGLRLKIAVKADGRTVGGGDFAAVGGVPLSLKLEELKPWSPESPFLYDLEFTVLDAAGGEIDRVASYAGLRKIAIEGDRIYLNNQPLFQRLVLDQGFYPDGNWTAPSDAALKRDIELSMSAGFNGARLHQKVFEERFHYWADRLGYLTWGEFPSWGFDIFSPEAQRNFLLEWSEIIERDASHPSIVAWTPLNETLPPFPERLQLQLGGEALERYRRFLRSVYDLTKRIDPTRPVNETSGYLHAKTDLWTVHVYRQNAEELMASLFPEGSPVFAHVPEVETGYTGQPYLNDEFGGFMFIPPDRAKFVESSWGYYGMELKTEDDLCAKIAEQVDAMLAASPRLAGYCYTQLTDVEQEQNGLYNYDRTPKVAPGKLAAIFGRKPAE